MAPIFKIALNLCRLQKNLPRKLLFGPIEVRGNGIHDPFYVQLTSHLQVILKHQVEDTPTKDLLQDTMEGVQYYVGSDQNFWELPFGDYGALAPTGWTKATWEALSDTQLTLRGPSVAVPTKRQHNTHIMDAAIQFPLPSGDITVIQRCRLFLGVTTLSDICTAHGSRIDNDVWRGRPSRSRTTASILAITPSNNDWEVWRSALQMLFLYPHSQTRLLRRQLGPWYTPADPQWCWYRDTTSDAVFEAINSVLWYQWSRCHRTGNYA